MSSDVEMIYFVDDKSGICELKKIKRPVLLFMNTYIGNSFLCNIQIKRLNGNILYISGDIA